jgi:hypothetical protein
MRKVILGVVAAAFSASIPNAASAAVYITEFMYQGASSGNREFIELTNVGNAAINVSGWSYNDSTTSDPVSFGTTFGSLAANESVILTEMTASAFRTYWGLSSSVRVFSIGGNSNLGNADTINIYNSATQNTSTLVDSVAYSGTTPGVSRNRPVGADGHVANSLFVNSVAGDVFGSALAPTTPRDLANPGSYPVVAAAVPETATWAMMIGGFGLVGGAMRRRRITAALLTA